MSSNGNGFATLPQWARIVGVLGFPTVVACVFLALFLGWVRSPLTDIVFQQQREAEIMAEILRQGNAFRADQRAATEYQNVLLRTLCRNYAHDATQCEPRYRGYEEPIK